MDDLGRWLTACFDEDTLWATEASRRYGEPAPEGGVHWQWETNSTDEVLTPNPGIEELVGGDNFRVSLRSRETWPTHSVGELPQFAIPVAEEVPSAVAGHIVRHDPARVLREIEVDRELLAEYERLLRAHAAHKAEAARMAEAGDDDPTRIAALRREADYLPAMLHVMERWAKQKAAVYVDRPGYAEAVASAG
jgi:hypothetical protein